MLLTTELQEEINLLMQFDLSSSQAGLKVHSKAPEGAIEAAKRLHNKGLVDHADGGYLTSLGREAAEHLQAGRQILVVK